MAKQTLKREKATFSSGGTSLKRAPKGFENPDFDSLFDGDRVPDPFADLNEDPDNWENLANDQVSATLQAIKDAKKERYDQYRTTVDTEYWFAVCFQNREQKLQFLEAIEAHYLGEKYLNGLALAELLGVEIEPVFLEKKEPKLAPVLLRATPIIGE